MNIIAIIIALVLAGPLGPNSLAGTETRDLQGVEGGGGAGLETMHQLPANDIIKHHFADPCHWSWITNDHSY